MPILKMAAIVCTLEAVVDAQTGCGYGLIKDENTAVAGVRKESQSVS
tara:strand:- start:3354 stop:3494 length:141 start_codon:yes stop_codon:yes gene_type:complete